MAVAQESTKKQVDSPRVVLYVEDTENVEIQRIGEALSKYLGGESSKEWAFEKTEELSKDKSSNTLSVSKFTIDAKSPFLVKLITAPDSESIYLPVIYAKYPKRLEDQSLSLPKVLDVVNATTKETKYYIHVSPWVDHVGSLADLTITFWMTKRSEPIVSLYTAFGQYLKQFRAQYPGLNHNDLNPANVLIQPVDGSFAFVLTDCAGFDDEVGDDYATFLKSIDVLAEGGFGDEFKSIATEAFAKGFNE
jgi:hypothetical protein